MEQIYSLIRQIGRSINLESEQIIKEHGLSAIQVFCLRILYDAPGFQTIQRELAEKMKLNASTLSSHIDRLEKKQMVVRLPKKGDKRAKNICLSTKGLNFLKSNPTLLNEKLLGRLSKAPEDEIKKIETGLKSMIKYLEIMEDYQ